MKEKFVKKYMRLAKQVGEDNNPCHSRSIGVVIVRAYEDGSGKVLGTGYNGPPRGTPHCSSPEYLKDVFWPQLTEEDKRTITNSISVLDFLPTAGDYDGQACEALCRVYGNKSICPRKLVNAPSGKRLELCSCVHAETNAIVNASDDLHGAFIFCWCGVPCIECTKLIINSGIKKVFAIDWGADYSHGSRWLFEKAGVEIIENLPEYYLE